MYADGSQEKGFGHLFRLHTIWHKHLQKYDCTFYCKNDLQRIFYKDRAIDALMLSDLEVGSQQESILFIDTKEEDISFIEPLFQQSVKKICVDSYNPWIERFDINIIPSFYSDHRLIKKMSSKCSIYTGRKYSIMRHDIENNIDSDHDLLVTFGGSDPNDLTTQILNYFKKLNLQRNVSIIVGPGFKKSVSDFKQNFPEHNFINCPRATFEHIAAANIVITSLGTTVQEIEHLNKKGVICFNYESDAHDFSLIQSASSNKKNWLSLGHYSDLKYDEIQYFFNEKADKQEKDLDSWGSGWDNICANL